MPAIEVGQRWQGTVGGTYDIIAVTADGVTVRNILVRATATESFRMPATYIQANWTFLPQVPVVF